VIVMVDVDGRLWLCSVSVSAVEDSVATAVLTIVAGDGGG
jgi:hypothetical protein